MSKAFKLIEVVGTSNESYAVAINSAVEQARKSISGLGWFEVTDLRGAILEKGLEDQATVKIGFRLRDE